MVVRSSPNTRPLMIKFPLRKSHWFTPFHCLVVNPFESKSVNKPGIVVQLIPASMRLPFVMYNEKGLLFLNTSTSMVTFPQLTMISSPCISLIVFMLISRSHCLQMTDLLSGGFFSYFGQSCAAFLLTRLRILDEFASAVLLSIVFVPARLTESTCLLLVSVEVPSPACPWTMILDNAPIRSGLSCPMVISPTPCIVSNIFP